MPISPTLSDHVATVQGTQQRGSAVGTLKTWESPLGLQSISPGILTDVLVIEVPDALKFGLEWQIGAGSASGIEFVEICQSDSGLAWDPIFQKTLNPASPEASPGAVQQIVEIDGWSARYLKVRVTSETGGGGSDIQVIATESIFSSGRLQVSDRLESSNSFQQNFEERQQHVYTEGVVSSAVVSTSEVMSIEQVSGPSPRTFNIEIGVKLTDRASLTTINIRPEIFFGGEWRSLQTFTVSAGVQIVTPGFQWQIPDIATNFNFNTGVEKVTAERVRYFISADVADGASLELYSILKVPY